MAVIRDSFSETENGGYVLQRKRIVSVRMKGPRCPVKKVVYWDVKKCKERVAGRNEIPQDYVDDPDLCAVYIEP